MLGTLLVNELMTAAFGRRPQERTLFFVFIGEFSHFVTKDACEILDGGRKIRLAFDFGPRTSGTAQRERSGNMLLDAYKRPHQDCIRWTER